ncbi:Swt1 family HEPN domain-containing protein [Mahella australiensis]|uniref:Swt1-like HEPN domain-containing protein n=1 Tax=Mahella australiensis (strain DSM 15567 / CIP 107919 / 50-1 BON) TaxID=697281 RepID=F4A0E1_MAHA5|nr:Swt1 family HEPN domain-containing protein [Mahella australiensis]AEE98002.1 hypothetical protein Mahau_2880 [Mahella australiensis 50-1 BON]
MGENIDMIGQGFRCLVKALAPYVARELQRQYADNWWKEGVLDVLWDDQKKDLPESGEWSELVDSLDIQRCLILMDANWNTVFKRKLTIDHRNWIKELIGIRNKWAHAGSQDFDEDYTWRALDTMARLAEHIDDESTEEIRALARQVRYGTAEASTTAAVQQPPIAAMQPDYDNGLPPWRYVIMPHPDVAQGRYKNAEFAADLAQVVHGEGAIEYKEPVEFFARTYITEGLSGLLVQVLKRVSGKGGEPVIQLKTAFGGGKTHSMLALYHLLRGTVSAESLMGVRSVLDKAGLSSVVKTNVAVLVGTALDPTKTRRPPKYSGISINTLWGEMAAQLAEQAGDMSLYEYVKEADKKGVSPGSQALRQLFDACGPCLVLIDELVAYAKKLYGVSDKLPAGTFDNLITFIQELSEAVRASKNSVVVVSIPESNIEIGEGGGRIALEAIEHVFGRVEAVWKPITASEGFEIVRRRLFLKPQDEAGLDKVCRAFSEMYNANPSDFPPECKEITYLERMKACYPIHPEVFDRLYGDWATLEHFQRTRGVLRLMAAVIHDLWMKNDNGLMIMPGSIALDNPSVRDELTKYLGDGWDAVVDKEIDGPNSEPYKIDKENPRFSKYMAARRVARTIMLGSAPSSREQHNRGIEISRIHLGVMQPDEQIAVFNDALAHLQRKLSYLYSDSYDLRFWYDTRPTLKKTAEDRAGQIPTSRAEEEIERRIKAIRERGDFAAVHACPSSSLDVPDEQEARLVVLPISCPYRRNDGQAVDYAMNIIDNRGNAPRIYKNMLAFVAADSDARVALIEDVKHYLAWRSILDDAEMLNLDMGQKREVENSVKRGDSAVNVRLQEAYCWLLIPVQEGTDPITLEIERISGYDESYVARASKKMIQKEALITKWSGIRLRMELDNWFWKGQQHVQIRKVWEAMCTYCYMPRLKNANVLLNAITEGVASDDRYFAYAEGYTDDGRYMGLRYKKPLMYVDINGYLVRPEAAEAQIEAEKAKEEASVSQPPVYEPPQDGGSNVNEGHTSGGVASGNTAIVEPPPRKKKIRRFYGTVALDPMRLGSHAGKIAEEIVQHLNVIPGAKVRIKLDIDVEVDDGIPDNVIRTVSENCNALKFESSSFEE